EGHGNVPRGGHIHVDVVHMGSEFGDDFERGRPIKHPVRHRIIPDNDGVDADEIGCHFVFRQGPGAGVCDDFVPCLLQDGQMLTLEIQKRPRGDQNARACHAIASSPSLLEIISSARRDSTIVRETPQPDNLFYSGSPPSCFAAPEWAMVHAAWCIGSYTCCSSLSCPERCLS